MATSDFASLLMGGLQGGSAGAGIASGLKAAGVAAGPWAPWLIPGAIGVGALGSLLSNQADQEDPQVQEERRRARGLNMFRSTVGRALHASQPKTFGGMLGAP